MGHIKCDNCDEERDYDKSLFKQDMYFICCCKCGAPDRYMDKFEHYIRISMKGKNGSDK